MSSRLSRIDARIAAGDAADAKAEALKALQDAPDFFLYFERLGRIARLEGRRDAAQGYKLAAERLACAEAPNADGPATRAVKDAALRIVLDNESPSGPHYQHIVSLAEALGAPMQLLAAWRERNSASDPADHDWRGALSRSEAAQALAEARIAMLIAQLEDARRELHMRTIGAANLAQERNAAQRERDALKRELEALKAARPATA
jgi:hypothetical protein